MTLEELIESMIRTAVEQGYSLDDIEVVFDNILGGRIEEEELIGFAE